MKRRPLNGAVVTGALLALLLAGLVFGCGPCEPAPTTEASCIERATRETNRPPAEIVELCTEAFPAR